MDSTINEAGAVVAQEKNMDNRRADDSRINEIHQWVKKLDGTIHGNGNDGMKTTQGKHGVHIKIQWWWLAVISVCLLGAAVRVVAS